MPRIPGHASIGKHLERSEKLEELRLQRTGAVSEHENKNSRKGLLA